MNYTALAHYLVVPKAACESWDYLPIKFTDKIGAGNYWNILRDAQLYQFGILSSSMHMAWLKCVSGKLNCHTHSTHSPNMRNFPWPIKHTQAHLSEIEVKALEILEIRAKYAHIPLNDLYNPFSMPTDLYRAHFALDKAVDAAYGQMTFSSDQNRISYLFNLDRQIANLLTSEEVFQPLPAAALGHAIHNRRMDRPLPDMLTGRLNPSMA